METSFPQSTADYLYSEYWKVGCSADLHMLPCLPNRVAIHASVALVLHIIDCMGVTAVEKLSN